MPYLFIFNMLVIFIAFVVSGNELQAVKKRMESLAKERIVQSDLDIGRMWAAISDIQIENDQLKESLAKQSDNILRCEKSLQEIDDLLSDAATKKDLDSGLEVFNINTSKMVQLLENVLNQNGQQLHNIELELDRMHDQLQDHEAILKKPQSKKTEVAKAKKPLKKPTKKIRAT